MVSALLLAVAWPAFLSLGDALSRTGWFHLTGDEALHAEVISNLSQTGKYQNWGGSPFALHLTTGPTVILPAALLSKVTKLSPAESGRAVVFVYHLFLLTVLTILIWNALSLTKAQTADRSKLHLILFSVLTIGFFHMGWRGLQETHYYLFGILGDGVAGFYFVGAVFFFLKRWFFWGGIFSSLAVLSKPYWILLPAMVLIMLLSSKKKLLLALGGMILPWMFWGGWMVTELGFERTFLLILAYPSLMRSANQAGLPTANEFSVLGLLVLVQKHFFSLFKLLKFRSLLMALVGFIYGAIHRKRSQVLYLLSLFGTLHFLWWFLLSPGSEPRYLLPALMSGWILFLLLFLNWLKEKIRSELIFQRREILFFLFPLFFISLIYFGVQVKSEWRKNEQNYKSCGFCRQLQIQKFWKKVVNQNPTHSPVIWITSQNYAQDMDLLLSAPALKKIWEEKAFLKAIKDQKLEHSSPTPYWILIGEDPNPRALQWIQKNNCREIYVVPTTTEGFWSCG